mgnify:FL=1
MSFFRFVKDNKVNILVSLLLFILVILLMFTFQVNSFLIIISIIFFLSSFIFLLLYNYFRKKKFYNELINNTKLLDKKYLVLETLNEPSFLEGKILYDSLYQIDKSMNERIKLYEKNLSDFKEYVEMWIHEVKIPLSSLSLMCHNHHNEIDKKYLNQINKLDNYVDQVLYYVRSNDAEKDFLIKKTNLEKIINSVMIKNKDEILLNNITVNVENLNIFVYTDTKWLIFIINQILNNSIKYKKKNGNSLIKIYATEEKDLVNLFIYDNGIGINKSDITRVFDKTFTGENGRKDANSTGMGLYIVKKLIDKLGHKISISSKENEYTEVKITFGKNNLYNIK